MAEDCASSGNRPKVPVFLLKTKSSPSDAYKDLFSTPHGNLHFEPTFVPVLQHCFQDDGLESVRELLREKKISRSMDGAYGGMIFTSQRAVEAFAKLVEERQDNDESWPHLQDVPIYSVGPATTRALKAIYQSPPLRIFGEHTGNGDALAQYILEHYGDWYHDRATKPPLLFLVGETRRDIIPKTLMDSALPADTRIEVTETVVYGTGVMESFSKDFDKALAITADRPTRWAVVFSPTGCDSMLRGLGLLPGEDDGNTGYGVASTLPGQRTTYIATIGPTTRDHLVNTFGIEPDVCAAKPSPEGVLDAIANFKCRSA